MAGSQRLLYRPGAGMTAASVGARSVRGRLQLLAERDDQGRTVLAKREHEGAFHLSKSYWDGHVLMVQWVNPTAGVFAGDVLESDVAVGPGASLLVTTPSATRIHTCISAEQPAGRQQQRFQVAKGGWLEVQPEWLIPQRGSAFRQITEIELEKGGGLFYAELLAPGRIAHGEALLFEELDLRLRLKVGGKLVVQERLYATAQRLWPLQGSDGLPLFVGTVIICHP
ncbi:MAG: urease accessory protein UreD, partial [Verrucomicrobiaceae bacterium]|nr:urease accessory protein UreD [Verrucomicrobiaceae bacterium]